MLVCVFGAQGALGYDIVSQLAIHGIPHLALGKESGNILDEIQLHNLFRNIRGITHVINCAGYTDVAKAEIEIEACHRLNVQGAINLASVCSKYKAKLLHFSSDYVYDGLKDSPYVEYDNCQPRNVYGESKRQADLAIQDIFQDYKILRVQWLYGMRGMNFLKKILMKHIESQRIEVVDDQWGCPNSTLFIAQVAVQTIMPNWEKMPTGVFNLTHDDSCSWYEFAQFFLSMYGIQKFVKPVSYKKFPITVSRPNKTILSVEKLKKSLDIKSMSTWKEDLKFFLSTYPGAFSDIVNKSFK